MREIGIALLGLGNVGLGTYRIADRGHLGANHIDVLMQTTREALSFGRQTRTVCRQ